MTVRAEAGWEATAGSLRALLAGIIDYAGLFPPARLDMASTLRNYAEYLHGSGAWMLGRLVIPAAQLHEFQEHARGLLPRGRGAEPWRITATVAAAGDQGLPRDLERIEAFNRVHADPATGLASIGSIELRCGSAAEVEAALDLLPDELFPFFELPVEPDPRGLLAALSGSDAGAKVRTGGGDPGSAPSPQQLARFIAACAAAEVPFKATAGLHHPLRHQVAAPGGAWEFGFLNVFAAAALASAGGASEADLCAILVEQSPASFAFEASGLRYGRRRLSNEQIEEARGAFALSFGSCSFTEPLEGLRALHLLQP